MFILFNSLHYVQLNTMIDSPRLFATNNSVEDETGNISLLTSPESGNSMGKLVMDTSGNVYSPDGKSNCVPIYIYWCDVATPYILLVHLTLTHLSSVKSLFINCMEYTNGNVTTY
jgi:hypothetical protein